MKVLIIGGGIGGLTTALACQHFSIDYELFEAAPEIREAGAGIWVPPNAMQIMDRLNIADSIEKAGKLLGSISVGGPKGDLWFTLPTEKVIKKFGFGTIAIHRGILQAILYKALDHNKVHTGKRLKGFVQDQNSVTAIFEDGTQNKGDCLIGADGIKSVTRKQLFGELPLRYSGQTCWRGLVKFQLPKEIEDGMFELWGELPGQRFAYSQINKDTVYYYATLATAAGERDELSGIKTRLHHYYDNYGTIAKSIIDVVEPETIIRTDLFDLSPINNWFQNKVVLLGDAAHATTPNLGQGAAQAIEDAYVLTSELKNNSDITSAFKSYQEKRIKKAHFIVETSWKIGQATNIKNKTGIALRNWFIKNTPDFITNKQIEKAYKINF